MKRFMYFGIGSLCLMLAVLTGFHLGSKNAVAQGSPAGPYSIGLWNDNRQWVIDSNGNVWVQDLGPTYTQPATFLGNFFTGDMGTVPTVPSTLGGIKSQYDKND